MNTAPQSGQRPIFFSDSLIGEYVEKWFGRAALERVETPCVVYSERRLRDNADSFLSAARSAFPAARAVYALKACPFAGIARILLDCGLGAEIQSELELKIARAAGFEDAELVVNGPSKSAKIVHAVTRAAGAVIADSVEEFLQLTESRGVVGLRINPTPPDSGLFISSSDKFGVGLDAVDELLAGDSRRPDLLHMHTLSRANCPDMVIKGFSPLSEWRDRHDARSNLRLNLGGGFDSRLRLEHQGTSLEELFKAYKGLFPDAEAPIFEPGRVMVEDAAVAVTTVQRIKTGADGATWAFVDMGTNLLVPIPAARFQVFPLAPSRGPKRLYSVADRVCSPNGVIGREIPLSELKEGARILVISCGAYTYSLAGSFCDPIAPALLFRQDGIVSPLLSARTANAIAESLFLGLAE